MRTTRAHSLIGAVLVLVAVWAAAAPVRAQSQLDPKSVTMFNSSVIAAERNYANGQLDTLPRAGLRVAAARLLSNTVTVSDSAKVDVYAD